jgi:hypothetical protein
MVLSLRLVFFSKSFADGVGCYTSIVDQEDSSSTIILSFLAIVVLETRKVRVSDTDVHPIILIHKRVVTY